MTDAKAPDTETLPQELKSVVVRWDQLAFKEVIVGEADLQYLQIFMALIPPSWLLSS